MIRQMLNALFFLFVAGHALAVAADQEEKRSTLTVRGEASIKVAADELFLSIGVKSEGASVDEALQKNNQAMEKVIASLSDLGLEKKELQTGRFNLQPLYAPPPKNRPENWEAKIVGYEAVNTVKVTTQKLNLAPKLIQNTAENGANMVQGLQFGLQDKEKWRLVAIDKAVENGASCAAALAKAAEVALGPILEINLDNSSPVNHFASKMVSFSYSGSPPIEEGEIELQASVTIVYLITPRK